MAKRPIFVPNFQGNQFVDAIPIEFTWYAGMSKVQKQKSIRSLHETAKKTRGLEKILEISSKSEDKLGIQLSAFNLMLKTPNGIYAPVEVLFQGSKVFSDGGPYTDIYQKSSREAKTDERLKTSGQLIMFRYEDFNWSLNPKTVFYDWLYLSALQQNLLLAQQLLKYNAFSDIEFNPEKSINCQASSAALYKSFFERNLLEFALISPENFLMTCKGKLNKPSLRQKELF